MAKFDLGCRQALAAEEIEARVSRWGEAERKGVERQVAQMSHNTLYLNKLMRDMELAGASGAEIQAAIDNLPDEVTGRTYFIARHCNDAGHS